VPSLLRREPGARELRRALLRGVIGVTLGLLLTAMNLPLAGADDAESPTPVAIAPASSNDATDPVQVEESEAAEPAPVDEGDVVTDEPVETETPSPSPEVPAEPKPEETEPSTDPTVIAKPSDPSDVTDPVIVEESAPAPEEVLAEDVLPESGSQITVQNTASLVELSALSIGDGCSFADPNTGAYATSLCWLNLEGVTTAYQHMSTETTYYTQGNRYYYTTRMIYESVLGSSYGNYTAEGTANSTNQTTARNNSISNAEANRATRMYNFGGTYYGSVTNYPIEIPLAGGRAFLANLTITAADGTSGLAAVATSFPTWGNADGSGTGSFLGRGSVYSGVAGSPAIYQLAGGTTSATLSSVRIVSGADTTANRILEYSMVVADAESTDSNESITWSHSNGGGYRWLPNDPAAWDAVPATSNGTNNRARRVAAVGNACHGTAGGTGGTGYNPTAWASLTIASPACAAGSSGQQSPKTGTPMLQISPANTTSNFQVTQTMVGGGLQGIAFGLIFGGAQVSVNVADRIVDSAGAATTATFEATVRRGTETTPFGTATAAGTALSLNPPVDVVRVFVLVDPVWD